MAATLAFVSGYFPVFESFTLTLPGIAGIILAIGKMCIRDRVETASELLCVCVRLAVVEKLLAEQA